MDYLSRSLGISLQVADFRELSHGEVRRIHIPDTPVNRPSPTRVSVAMAPSVRSPASRTPYSPHLSVWKASARFLPPPSLDLRASRRASALCQSPRLCARSRLPPRRGRRGPLR